MLYLHLYPKVPRRTRYGLFYMVKRARILPKHSTNSLMHYSLRIVEILLDVFTTFAQEKVAWALYARISKKSTGRSYHSI